MSCKLSYPVTTANVKRAKSVARVDTAMEVTGRSTATEVCGNIVFNSLNIVAHMKVWRGSIATVITATVNTASASPATEDAEVTERSSTNMIIVPSFVINLRFMKINLFLVSIKC